MISAIVAVDVNWGIGFDGELLERIPEDMKRFRELTENNIVIMGRKTWDSLPSGPLPNRTNVVISSKYNWTAFSGKEKPPLVCSDMGHVKEYLPKLYDKDIFIIGGGQIYQQLLPYCDRVYVTKIHQAYWNVDTYFPIDLDASPEWRQVETGETREYGNIAYHFLTYERV